MWGPAVVKDRHPGCLGRRGIDWTEPRLGDQIGTKRERRVRRQLLNVAVRMVPSRTQQRPCPRKKGLSHGLLFRRKADWPACHLPPCHWDPASRLAASSLHANAGCPTPRREVATVPSRRRRTQASPSTRQSPRALGLRGSECSSSSFLPDVRRCGDRVPI